MNFFTGGPRQLPPKPVSLADLADKVLIAQAAYDQALAEREADRQDAENKLTKKQLPAPATTVTWHDSQPQISVVGDMQAELESISKP